MASAIEPGLSRITVHVRRPAGEEHGESLFSDPHIGAAGFDERQFKADLKAAWDRGDGIALNGDVFDLILPSDRKRFEASVLHPRLHGEDDILGATVEWGREILQPYAEAISWVSPGNHETAVRQHHSYDATKALARGLHPSPLVAGYAGWARYARSGSPAFNLFHWHGAGKGSGKVAGLLTDLAAKGGFVEGADAVWHGHFHGLAVSRVSKITPQKRMRHCWLIRTPSYLDGYAARSYASESLHAPYPAGCVRLVMCPDGTSRVEVR